MAGMIIIIIYLVYNNVVHMVTIVVMLAGSGYTLLRKIQIIVPALNSPDLYTHYKISL